MPITQITLVSSDASGNVGNSTSYQLSRGSAFSADGRYVAFYSNASNLVSGDTNNTPDISSRTCRPAPSPGCRPTPAVTREILTEGKNKMIERLITIIMVLLAFSIAPSGLPLSSISGAGSRAIGFLNLPLIF
jgi:hypothetical protein